MATQLQILGFKGEGIADDTTWISRANHPITGLGSLIFTSYKTFVCVRNPLDVFVSFASFITTANHSAVPQWEVERDYPEWWDWWIKCAVDNMKKNYDELKRVYIDQGRNPIYFVRYEDLVTSKKETMMGLFSFLLETKDLKDTNCERRIDSVIDQGESSGLTYKLKSTTGKFNAHKHRYTEKQISFIKESLKEHLHFFGYTTNAEEDNPFGFFDFGDDTEH